LKSHTATLVRRPAEKLLMFREDVVKQMFYTLFTIKRFLLRNLGDGCLHFINAHAWENRIRSHTEPLFGEVGIPQLCFYLIAAENGVANGSWIENFF
jgi:hypothetical protein